MSDEEIQIEMQKACGWNLRNASSMMPGTWYHPDKRVNEIPPNYLKDLNAMHEAEKVLDFNQFDLYLCALQQMCKSFFSEGGYEVRATAKQRAEAFLKTLGKWTE